MCWYPAWLIRTAFRAASLVFGVTVVLSRYILDEMARVLPRLPRIQLSSSDVRDLVDSLMFLADVVEPVDHVEVMLRDTADQKVLGTFLAAKADYLITGDKDLLALVEKYPIITPASFCERHS